MRYTPVARCKNLPLTSLALTTHHATSKCTAAVQAYLQFLVARSLGGKTLGIVTTYAMWATRPDLPVNFLLHCRYDSQLARFKQEGTNKGTKRMLVHMSYLERLHSEATGRVTGSEITRMREATQGRHRLIGRSSKTGLLQSTRVRPSGKLTEYERFFFND